MDVPFLKCFYSRLAFLLGNPGRFVPAALLLPSLLRRGGLLLLHRDAQPPGDDAEDGRDGQRTEVGPDGLGELRRVHLGKAAEQADHKEGQRPG